VPSRNKDERDTTARRTGLPPGWRAQGQQAFDPLTGTLLISGTAPSKGPSLPRLFARRVRATKYVSVVDRWATKHALTNSVENLFVRTWVLGRDSYVFFILSDLTEVATGHGAEQSISEVDSMLIDVNFLPSSKKPEPVRQRATTVIKDVGMLRLDLRDFSVESWLEPTVGKRRLIVSGLVPSGGADDCVHAVVGFPARGMGNCTVISYFLVRIRWKTKVVKKIRGMPNIWY